ncbi:MAG TPA: bifunctional 3-(3-hydroxy-phenyl)propionate/3-hydroxycinnamic acid hydroxylase [Pseudolabrys sp.]
MVDPHYPVAIVGAGPTGLTLANLLGVYGVPCVVIERNAATVQEPRAVSIDDESLRTMQAAGLVEEVMRETVHGYGSHYFSARGRCFAKVQPTEQPYGFPRRNAFRQPILEQQLRDALARFQHVTPLFQHELISFTQDAKGVTLRVSHDGGEREIACDYLIACDGASSIVRRQLGITLGGSTFRERWLIVDLENSPVTSPHTKVFSNPKRPCIALPGPDLTRRYEFMLHDHERDEDLLAPEMVKHLMETHEAAPQSRIVRTVVYTFHARLADRWSEGRVYLAGDAAHLTPPFAGQGMNSGLRDAYNLSWKLAAVTRGTLGPGLLASYEPERRDHVWAMIEFALNIGRVLAPPNALAAWAIEQSFRALSLYPKARDYIAQMKFKPPPRFAKGFIVPDGENARRTLVGRMFPQPRVRTADGRDVLLDEALGPGFALLVRGPRAELALPTLNTAPFAALAARIVLMRPEGGARDAPPGITVVHDVGPPSPRIAELSDHIILLRPDRYVAACMAVDELEAGGAKIGKLIAGTFTG